MKVSEINEMTNKELIERLQNEQDTLLRLKMNHAVSPLDNPMKLNQSRKNIARLKTVLRARELNGNKN